MSIRVIIVLTAALLGVACSGADDAYPIGDPVVIQTPLGLPEVPVPKDSPLTADLIALGRRLFNEVRLSSDNTVSCASCHNPSQHFADGLAVAKGIGGQHGTRNTPTVLNAAYSVAQFWDGRAATLEQQAGVPISAPNEMNQSHEACVTKLSADEEYKRAFEKVFGPGPITFLRIEKAIAAFERTLLSGNSAFDLYQYAGSKNALSEAAIRGLQVFTDRNKGNCATCHIIGESYALFTDGKFHNLGVGMNPSGELTDMGRFNHSGVESDRGKFRTPSLRNVAKTAPYMHDGSLKTLPEVIAFYMGGGNSNPQLDVEIRPLMLSAQDRSDLLAFLDALTGDIPSVDGLQGRKR